MMAIPGRTRQKSLGSMLCGHCDAGAAATQEAGGLQELSGYATKVDSARGSKGSQT